MNSLRVKILFGMVAAMGSMDTSALELKFNTQDFAPFSYAIDGDTAGPAVDVIKRVCAEVPVTCTFKLLPWSRAQKEVQDGAAHAMFLIGWNPEREQWLTFSPPLVETTYGFFVKSTNPLDYRKRSDVAGYTVGVYGPSNTARSLEQIRDQLHQQGLAPLTIDMRPDDEAGFKKLSLQRVQAVYSNYDVGKATIAKLGLGDIRYAGADERLQYYIGFSKQYADASAVQQFNAAFRRLHKNGVIASILAAYQMKDVPENRWIQH